MKIDTISGIEYYDINDGYFNKRIFNCDAPEGAYISKEELDCGKFTIITRAKVIPLNDLLSQYSINFNFQTPESLEKFLENNKTNLSDNDIEVFKKQIGELRIKRNVESEEKEFQKLYEESYSELLKLTRTENKNCTKQIEQQIHYYAKDIDILLKNHIIDWSIKYFSNEKYIVGDFSKYGYKSKIKPDINKSIYKSDVSYKESCNEINEYIRNIKSKKYDIDFISSLYCLPKRTKNNIYRVDNTYVTNESDMKANGTWSVQYPKKTKRSSLYNPYFATIQYVYNGINNKQTFEEIYESFIYINDLCNYMIDNLNVKTKDIEKDLSSTDNVQDWVEIFRKHISK